MSTPARAEKTPSALQGASRFGHQAGALAAPARRPSSAQKDRARARSRSHARLTKTGAAADNGSLHADPAAHAGMLG